MRREHRDVSELVRDPALFAIGNLSLLGLTLKTHHLKTHLTTAIIT